MVSTGWSNEPSPMATGASSFPLGKSYAVSPTDDELRKEGIEGLLKRLRMCEHENRKLVRILSDKNQSMHSNLNQYRATTELNQRMKIEKKAMLTEKEELTAMLVYFDDDRNKWKKVAREWQKYGRYATGILQKEVTSFNSKSKDLESKQAQLVQENRTLKDIIAMLDLENTGSRDSVNSQNSLPSASAGLLSVSGTRDSGDGSSNGSTTGSSSPDHRSSSHRAKEVLYSSDPATGSSYVRYLEHKVRQLEEESKGRIKNDRGCGGQATTPASASTSPAGKLQRRFFSSSSSTSMLLPSTIAIPPPPTALSKLMKQQPTSPSSSTSSSSCELPMATAVRLTTTTRQLPQQKALMEHSAVPVDFPALSSSSSSSLSLTAPVTIKPPQQQQQQLDERDRASVRDMCNTVWKKLAENKQRMAATSGGSVMATKPPTTPTHKTQSVSNL